VTSAGVRLVTYSPTNADLVSALSFSAPSPWLTTVTRPGSPSGHMRTPAPTAPSLHPRRAVA